MTHGSLLPVGNPVLHRDTVDSLRFLIFSPTPFSPDLPAKDRQPGPYIALDCEMVGVGPMGSESTLARVSVVNYFGVVLMDEFVRQKERVTDWRTRWSGVRARDMINGDFHWLSPLYVLTVSLLFPAKTFEEVQGAVAELMKDRIVIGHAIHNDLKVRFAFYLLARGAQILPLRPSCSRIRGRKFAILKFWPIGMAKAAPLNQL